MSGQLQRCTKIGYESASGTHLALRNKLLLRLATS